MTSARFRTPAALRWLARVMNERWGTAFELRKEGGSLALVLGEQSARLVFDASHTSFDGSTSALPCSRWSPEAEGWQSALGKPLPAPGLRQLPAPLCERTGGGHVVHYDLPALLFWMLARVEELGSRELDSHTRFPAGASHAKRHDYLERPLVDEWLFWLQQVVERTWPGAITRRAAFSQRVSHDVDAPARYGFCSPTRLVSAIGGDILKRRDFRSLYRAPWLRLGAGGTLNPRDPYNTFDWIMAESEQRGLASAFYFICGRTHKKRDAQYDPEHPAIRELMRRIHARGHEIGLHPSYATFEAPELLAAEAARLKRVCAEEGIKQAEWGGRMHFLRWQTPITLQGWELAGMSYESSLSYADWAGFRAGTCFEYPAFDPVQDRELALRLRPLVAMECTVIDPRYMALGTGSAAFDKFMELKRACRAVGGCFTLLWHNSRFTPVERELYRAVLDAA